MTVYAQCFLYIKISIGGSLRSPQLGVFPQSPLAPASYALRIWRSPIWGRGGGLWPPQPSQYSADDQTGRKATAVIAVRSSLAPGLPLRW